MPPARPNTKRLRTLASLLSGYRPGLTLVLPLPTKFAKRFPKTASLKDLETKIWWWRSATEERCGELFRCKDLPSEKAQNEYARVRLQRFWDMLSVSAHFYEFRARYSGRYVWPFGMPWVDCSIDQQERLFALLPGDHPAQGFAPVGRTVDHYATLPARFVNLSLNDWTLIEEFLIEIKALRRSHGIQAPQRGKGRRTRALSWAAIEAMDLRRYAIGELTDSQRSALSKDKRRYEATCRHLGIAP